MYKKGDKVRVIDQPNMRTPGISIGDIFRVEEICLCKDDESLSCVLVDWIGWKTFANGRWHDDRRYIYFSDIELITEEDTENTIEPSCTCRSLFLNNPDPSCPYHSRFAAERTAKP